MYQLEKFINATRYEKYIITSVPVTEVTWRPSSTVIKRTDESEIGNVPCYKNSTWQAMISGKV